MQLVTLRLLTDAVGTAWNTSACGCRQTTATCCREGCYDCFRVDCPGCDGTGCKDYARWKAGGFKVDHSPTLPPHQTFPRRLHVKSGLPDQPLPSGELHARRSSRLTPVRNPNGRLRHRVSRSLPQVHVNRRTAKTSLSTCASSRMASRSSGRSS